MALLQLGRYHQALILANKSIELVPRQSEKYQQFCQIEFFVHYREHHYQRAVAIRNKALSAGRISRHWKNRWRFLAAAIQFSLSNYKEVNKNLLGFKGISRGNLSHQIGVKLLEILTILELEDFDWFEFRLDSFRKKIACSGTKLDSRLNLIYRLFRILIKVNYHYPSLRTTKFREEYHSLIISLKQQHWDTMGYEIINIAQWFSLKTDNSL